MHPLLTRQIKRYLGETDRLGLELQCFINAVEQSYRQFEEDAQFNERALELVSVELNERNSRLRHSERSTAESAHSYTQIADRLAVVQSKLQALQSQLTANPSPACSAQTCADLREALGEIEKLAEVAPPGPNAELTDQPAPSRN